MEALVSRGKGGGGAVACTANQNEKGRRQVNQGEQMAQILNFLLKNGMNGVGSGVRERGARASSSSSAGKRGCCFFWLFVGEVGSQLFSFLVAKAGGGWVVVGV